MGTVRHAGAGKSLLSTRRKHEAGFRREGQLLMKFRDMLRAYLARVNGWSCLRRNIPRLARSGQRLHISSIVERL